MCNVNRETRLTLSRDVPGMLLTQGEYADAVIEFLEREYLKRQKSVSRTVGGDFSK